MEGSLWDWVRLCTSGELAYQFGSLDVVLLQRGQCQWGHVERLALGDAAHYARSCTRLL